MANDAAHQKALEEMKEIVPYAVASKSGTDYDGSRFRIPFFNRVFIVHYPEIKVIEEGNSAPVPQYLEIILLHYLLQASGVPVTDEWIAYRQLPGSALFSARFMQMAVNPLLKAFGDEVEAFRKAGEAVGGIPIIRTGDVAFRFTALPRIPIACIYYQGEEGLASSVNILFDASAEHYLPTEDLSLLGVILVGALRKAKPK
ncbi:MAG: DUF3786 domain-containing protein [Dehalococcoidia bacterium]|nr:MAG: DUF3786 domain-containing protein [Dehalococcoidia bacterium]